MEEILDRDVAVIDAHHHLFDRIDERLAAHLGLRRFLVDDYLDLIGTGHNVVGSVVVEARSMYRAYGAPEMRPVGETEFLNGQAAMSASGLYGPCRVAAGIVTFADLALGDGAKAVLEAHIAAAPARFKGVRQEALWDADGTILGDFFDTPAGFYLDDRFREGFRHLAPLGLSFDAFVLAPQLGDALDLARRFPETSIILNHVGSPVGIGRHAGRLDEEYPLWKRDMTLIAECPNVTLKLGGLGSYLLGSSFYRADPPATAETLRAEWAPYAEPALELFGAHRCMFESNLPTDGSGSFDAVCNAYKLMTQSCSLTERSAIFSGTADRVYKLGLLETTPSQP